MKDSTKTHYNTNNTLGSRLHLIETLVSCGADVILDLYRTGYTALSDDCPVP